MTLGFKQRIKERKTYFIEKVWQGLKEFGLSDEAEYEKYLKEHLVKFQIKWNGKDVYIFKRMWVYPKIHTIREDEHDRWGLGCDIHFVINNRTTNRFQFAPVIKCTGTQKISIKWLGGSPVVMVGNRRLIDDEVYSLAVNDGFDDEEDFFKWFKEDFEGKIIHWTDIRY